MRDRNGVQLGPPTQGPFHTPTSESRRRGDGKGRRILSQKVDDLATMILHPTPTHTYKYNRHRIHAHAHIVSLTLSLSLSSSCLLLHEEYHPYKGPLSILFAYQGISNSSDRVEKIKKESLFQFATILSLSLSVFFCVCACMLNTKSDLNRDV